MEKKPSKNRFEYPTVCSIEYSGYFSFYAATRNELKYEDLSTLRNERVNP